MINHKIMLFQKNSNFISAYINQCNGQNTRLLYSQVGTLKNLSIWLCIISTINIFISCAGSTSQAPIKPQRAYVNIEAIKLYPLLENIFLAEGFKIAERDYARGYIITEWKEGEGERHGLVRWTERRRYIAHFDVDRLNGKHLLILDVDVQERAPVSSSWSKTGFDKFSDEQYQRILIKLDEAVKNNGGAFS